MWILAEESLGGFQHFMFASIALHRGVFFLALYPVG